MPEPTITLREWAINWLRNFRRCIFLELSFHTEVAYEFKLNSRNETIAEESDFFHSRTLRENFLGLLASQYSQNPEVFSEPLVIFNQSNNTIQLAEWFAILLKKTMFYNPNSPALTVFFHLPPLLDLEDTVFSGDPIPIEILEVNLIFSAVK